jgi:alpha-N-arabinofuranosidase
MRRANGHEKPYKVKYWALGNEIWGPWSVIRLLSQCDFENANLKSYRQVEQDTKEHYAKKAHQWAKGK